MVVLDLAYNDYASFKDIKKQIKPNEIIKKYKNVITLNTFSKAYGLGGMRVGYGVSTNEIISNLYKLRPPFNITTLSLSSAICALSDEKFVKKSIEKNFKQMNVYEKFAKVNNISFINSYTNFIVYIFENKAYKHKKNIATFICDNLLKKGIIIRNISYYNPNAIRITIGTKAQNKIVLKELKIILKNIVVN
jgi:histidinol-phosphate aminotransferase